MSNNRQHIWPGSRPSPRNQWYVAAFDDEVTATPLARMILGDRIALYRTEDGEAVALADYCAHRAMALSKGKRVAGDRLQCPYHGLEFGRDGACRHVPSQDTVPKDMRVRTYPLARRWKWIWIWMGDAEQADESLIPDHSAFWFDDQSDFWKVKLWRMELACNAQLIQENLLDVSHVTFLHEGAVDNGSLATVPTRTTVEGNVITSMRQWDDEMAGLYAQTFGIADGSRVNRTNIAKTYVPSLNISINRFAHLDRDEPEKILVAPMGITPETDASCHYFFALGANYGDEPEGEMLEMRAKGLWNVVLEDRVAVEYIQQAYLKFGAETPDHSLRADQAALYYRHLLTKLVEEEAGEEAGKPPAG